MAVFRIEKTKDYTVMSNHHLKNTQLSLKAKGLLSLILSLPENWDYTTKGLAHICKEGVDSICSTIKELEQHGYIIRNRVRNAKGQLTTMEYTILEEPKCTVPEQAKPIQNKPTQKEPVWENPTQDNTAQLNTNISITNQENKKELNTDVSNTYPILSIPEENVKDSMTDIQSKSDRIGLDMIDAYRDLIKSNIEYDILSINFKNDKIMLDEIVDLLTETVCSAREIITIAGDDFPAAVVKSKLLKLNSEHIEYVIDCVKANTTDVRNIKKYLLAALFNAPSTIDSFYRSKVNHDLHGGGYV